MIRKPLGFRQRAMDARRPTDSTDAVEPFLWDVHKYTNDYIRFADTKAAFMVAVSTALIGTLVSSSVFDSSFHQNLCHWTVYRWSAWGGLLLLICSLLSGVMVIRPRLWNKANPGYIFWNSVVAHRTPERFAVALGKLSAADRTRQVSDHLFILARIAERKYTLVAFGLLSGTIGGLLTGAVLLLRRAWH
jgi:Family of unknown function (DUF5706)